MSTNTTEKVTKYTRSIDKSDMPEVIDSNLCRYKIQYCKQKTSVLEPFIQNSETVSLGKEIRNDIEYIPLVLDKIQNYNPIYQIFFEMNEKNYNNITLNHKYKCVGIDKICEQDNISTYKTQPIFMKYAPLLDPLHYLVGTYTETKEQLTCLPSIPDNENESCSKLLTYNNASYIDNFYCYLSSQLLNHHGLHHGIDYYGSALAIQSKFRFNAIDDLDYLMQSTYFRTNRGILYEIEDIVEDPFANFGSRRNKNKLVLEEDVDIADLGIDVLDDLQVDCQVKDNNDTMEIVEDLIEPTVNTVLKDTDSDSDTDSDIDVSDVGDDEGGDDSEGDDSEGEDDSEGDHDSEEEEDDSEEEEDDSESEEEEEKFAYIFNFPVQVIMLEKCQGTLDQLFVRGNIQDENMANAILMQIIMTLLVYQKAYHFTHNDLHTNNVMWNETDEPFLFYKFNGKIYRVPTFGKIFKIIDFGRSIYKFGGKVFCSDSFSPKGDASSQYNFEPFFNEKKARLEPNYSFDLCRLGTSLYDFIFEEGREPDKKKMDSFQRTIYRWCTDDNGSNVLYKKNGEERYPGFKLYKMIARLVHKHTPEAQLELKPFCNYVYSDKLTNRNKIMDIDLIPDYTHAHV
jgi:hypothetical protein